MRRHPAHTRANRAGWRVTSPYTFIPIAVVMAIVGILLPLALFSLLIAVAAIALVSFLAYVAAVGTNRASNTMLVLAFGFAPLTLFGQGRGPVVLATALFAAAFALAIPRLASRAVRLPGMFVLGSVLFIVMGLVAAPFADSGSVSLAYLLTAVFALVVVPAAVAWMAPTNGQMFAMALAFGIGTAISTLYGLPHNVYRNAGFTYHPVALGYTAMLTLSFVPFLLLTKVRGRWLMVPPVALIALVGVWTSGSRTGLVALIALVVLIPLLERSVRLGIAVTSGVVLALPSLMSVDTSSNSTSALSRLLGAGGAQNSDTIREDTLRDGWRLVQQNPIFGNGYSVERTYTIHNIYLQVLSAEGLIGLIGLLLILTALVATLRKASAPRRCLAYPALAVIIAGPFQPNMSDTYLGLALGLSLVAATEAMKSRQPAGDLSAVARQRGRAGY